MSTNKWMDKETVVLVHNEVLLNIRRNAFESVLMKWMNLGPVMHSGVSEKEKNRKFIFTYIWASQVAPVVKNPAASAGRWKRRWSSPWSGKVPWRRKWQPSPGFLLENLLGRRAWRVAAVQRVAQSWTQLKGLSTRACTWTLETWQWRICLQGSSGDADGTALWAQGGREGEGGESSLGARMLPRVEQRADGRSLYDAWSQTWRSVTTWRGWDGWEV